MTDDLPDYTRKVVIDQTVPPSTQVQVDHQKIKGDPLIDPSVAGALPVSVENPTLNVDVTIPEPLEVDLTHVKGVPLKTPTIAASIPTSVENPAIAYDPTSDTFKVSTTAGGGPTAQDLQKVSGTAQTARDWSPDLAKLQNIPTDPAKESGKLTNIDSRIGALQATTPATYNVTMTNADTEYSQALPGNAKKFTIATRDRSAWRLAWVTGKVAGSTAPYFDVLANEIYFEDGLNMPATTIYFASASAGKIIEIIVWT